MSRWKLFLILILAVVLLHILIIKIFIIGNSEDKPLKPSTSSEKIASGKVSSWPEPQITENPRKK